MGQTTTDSVAGTANDNTIVQYNLHGYPTSNKCPISSGKSVSHQRNYLPKYFQCCQREWIYRS